MAALRHHAEVLPFTMPDTTGQSRLDSSTPGSSTPPVPMTELTDQGKSPSSGGNDLSEAWRLKPAGDSLAAPNDLTLDAALPSALRTANTDDTPEQIGPYRILEKIGEGGMGVVYQAEQRTPVRRIVALKVIKIGMDTREVVARFEAERQALAMMSHPNVARVLDAAATDTGRPYFVMEYVPGVPLTDFCDEQKLTVRQRLELFCEVCHAIQHAHQKGIIHRDLKPSNILVSLIDGKAVPKVIDFGIAKATTNSFLTDSTVHTLHGMLIGTPEYASPEQAMTSGQDVDTRSDVYSLGVILYQLLTGTLPLDARTLRRDGPEGIARILREVEPPKPSTRISQIRRDAPTQSGAKKTPTGIAPPLEQSTPWANPVAPVPTTSTFHDLVRTRQADPRTFGKDLRGDLDWITITAMEKDRARRYATAQDLAADITRYLADEPVLARPPSTRYRVGKFIRRHRVGAAAIAAVTVVLIGGVLGTTYGMIRARAAQEQAEASQALAEKARLAALDAKQVAETERSNAQAALAALRKAQTQAVDGAIRAAEQAERLLLTKPVEAERLAGPAYDRLLAGLGPDAPVTLACADIAGRAYLANGKSNDAIKLLREASERARSVSWTTTDPAFALAPRGRLFSDLADALTADSQKQADRVAAADEATALRREALGLFRSDASDKSPVQLDVGEKLASTLLAAGKLDDAEKAFEQTLDDHRRLLGDEDKRTGKIIDRLATLLIQSGRNEKALVVVKNQLVRISKLTDTDDESRISRRVDVADVLLRLGRSEEASVQFAEALAIARQRRIGAEGGNQIIWRFLSLRGSFGNPSEWQSQSLRGNAWLAMEEALTRSPSRSLVADEVHWSQLRFKLHRWNGSSPGNVARPAAGPADPQLAAGQLAEQPLSASTLHASGNLTDLKNLKDPPPGVYLLGMQVSRSDGPTIRGATWILMSDWKVAMYEPSADFSQTDRPKSFWHAITATKPTNRVEQKSLLLLYAANAAERVFGIRIEQGAAGRLYDWAATGETRVTLPKGLYRMALSSDDGARLHIDGQTKIDGWRSRALQTDANIIDLAGGPHELRVEYFQGVGDYMLRVQFEPYAPEADALIADALGENASETRRWLVREGQWLERLSRWPEAVERYRRAMEIGVQFTNIEQDMFLQTLRGLARSMARTGQSSEVAPFIEQQVKSAAKTGEPVGEVAAEALLFAARLRSLSGEPDRARADLDLALLAGKDQPGLNDPRGRRLYRRIILERFGASQIPNDGRIPAQLLCALDEAMLEDKSLIESLQSASAEQVSWKLVRWDPSAGNPTVAEGTFASLPTVKPVESGIYLVQFQVPQSGGSASRKAAQWIFAQHWESTVYVPDGEGILERFAFYLLQNPFRAVAWPDLYGLATIDALQSEPVPDGPIHRYGMDSTCRLRLPRGRYRFLATVADGIRLNIGDRRIIQCWPSRQYSRLDFADADFDGGSHTVRVEHYRSNAEDKLFLRIEPLDPAARALATSLGAKAKPVEEVIADQNDALKDDAFHAAAYSARGTLMVRAGRMEAAISDLTAAAATDAFEALFPQQRLAAIWLGGDDGAYRKAFNDTIYWRFPNQDRTAAARTVIALLLADRKPPTNSADKLNTLLAIATTPSPAGNAPQALFAKALLAYRWGDMSQASKHLEAATGTPSGSRGHAVMCDYLAAMIAKRSGNPAAAKSAFESGVEKFAAWEKDAADLRWDAFDTVDWMVCRALKPQAADNKGS